MDARSELEEAYDHASDLQGELQRAAREDAVWALRNELARVQAGIHAREIELGLTPSVPLKIRPDNPKEKDSDISF